MNVNIYYGGRGMIDDPTLFVLNKMQEVLDELKVNVKRYDLHEMRNSKDSFLKLEIMVKLAKARGLDAICITDHDNMGIKEFAAEYSKKTGFPITTGKPSPAEPGTDRIRFICGPG